MTAGWGMEAVLRSPGKRTLLVVGAVLVGAVVGTLQTYEWDPDLLRRAFDQAEAQAGRGFFRGGSLDQFLPWYVVFCYKVAGWGVWGLVLPSILRLGAWTVRVLRRPWWILLAQLPLALFVAAGTTVATEYLTHDRLTRFDGHLPERLPSWWRVRGRSFEEYLYRRPIRRSSRLPREVLFYLAVLGIGYAAATYLRQRDAERKSASLALRTAQLETEVVRTKVGALQNQLQPHFLFNSLNSVSGLIRSGETRGSLRALSALGALLRATLEVGDAQEHELQCELEIVDLYLQVEAIRLGDRLEVRREVDDSARARCIPTLALLPLVENAIVHGVAPRVEGGTVFIGVRLEEDVVVVEVSDDGPGFPDWVRSGAPAPPSDGGRRHIGLANTVKRMSLLYPDAATVELGESEGGGARIVLRIPNED